MTRSRGPARALGGWTLIELLAVLAVAATLAAAAIPAFRGLAADARRSARVNELLASLIYARSEAAKRGATVIACGVADADGDGAIGPSERTCLGLDWSGGWLVAAWRDDGDRRVDPGELELLVARAADPKEGLRVIANGLAASPPVRPLGTAALETFGRHSSNGTITICDRRGSAEARAVVISPTGRARSSKTRADGRPLACP